MLEHPDEDARVSLGYERREVVGIDCAARIPDRAIDGTELGGSGHVGYREPPERRRVARAREEERLARLAVPARSPDHLDVALDRVRVVDETDEPHVGLVDPHAERRRRDDGLRPAGDEVVLDARPLLRLEPGVVVLGSEAVTAEDARELLRRPARARVDDRRAAAQRVKPLDEDRNAVLGVRRPPRRRSAGSVA